HLFSSSYTHHNRQELVTSGMLATLEGMIIRRHQILELKRKLSENETCDEPYKTVSRYVDYRQAVYYGIAVSFNVIISCFFWIAVGWPEGSVAALISTVICCFFASLDAPPTAILAFLIAVTVGSIIAGLYTFVLFPRIDGFPLFALVMALSCIPIGLGM